MNNVNYEKIYEGIISRLLKKNSPDISNVKKAYLFAKEKHSGQFRKSGEPYILHPTCVAEILEKQDFDTNVIAAAFLHDVIEDCGVTHEEIKENFNGIIAEIVEAVTAITNDNFKPDFENLFSNPEEFLKFAIEDKTYQKLIKMGKINKLAFYIKFADRIHNLSTIDCFPKHKIIEKIEETKKWITPFTILLKSRFFYNTIRNLCFKAKYLDTTSTFFDDYSRFFKDTKKQTTLHKYNLFNTFKEYTEKYDKHITLNDIIIEKKTEHDIYDLIRKKFNINSILKTKQSNFNFVPTRNVYFIFDTELSPCQSTSFMLDILTKTKEKKYTVCGMETDIFGNNFVVFKDKNHNMFSCIALSKPDYTKITNGTTEGTDIDDIDETNAGKIVTSFINVYTRSNQILRLPKNSTVLDFAFKIHNEIGFSCEYAIINGSPTKMPIYTKLHNGDKIEVFNKVGEDGLLKNISKLRWLMYTENESTQKNLIKYFEKKYGER